MNSEDGGRSKSAIIKKIIYWALVVLFILWVSNRAADFEEVFEVLKHGDKNWILFAFFLQVVFLCLSGLFYNYSLKLVGYRVSSLSGILGYIASQFLSITTPLGTFGSTTYLARRFSKELPVSFGGIASAMMYGMSTLNAGFLPILLPATVIFYYTDSPLFTPTLITGSLYIGMIFLYWAIMFFGAARPLLLKTLFFSIKRFYQKLGRLNENSLFTLSDDLLDRNLQDFIISTKALKSGNSKKDIGKGFLFAFALHLFQMLILLLVFQSFGYGPTFEVLFLTYAVFYLFTVLSPTPQGIGIVEGVVQVVLSSLAVYGGVSFVVTLVYRAISTWFPVILGFLFFKIDNSKSKSIKV